MTERRRDARREQDVLPHSLDAERAVLGAILVSPPVLMLLPVGFTGKSFYREAHRKVYEALVALHGRGVEIDLLTVREELTRTGDLDAVGGVSYLTALTDGVPRSTNAPHYAAVVADHAVRRSMITLGNTIMLDAYAAELPPADLLVTAQQGLLDAMRHDSIGEPHLLRDLILPTLESIELITATVEAGVEQAGVIGIATGFTVLDNMTAGLQRGDLCLLAARPSLGKTALAGNIAEYATREGVVLIFSLEMTEGALVHRMISSRARVDGHMMRIGRLNAFELERTRMAGLDLQALPIVIDDHAGLPVEDLGRRARRVMVEHGPLSLVVIDYLQLLQTRGRFENRNQQVSFISRSVKVMAKELDVPCLALSQLSRMVEGRKDHRPILSDLRESGALEQDADLVMFLHRDEADDDRPADLIVAKQRNGPLGVVHLKFSKEYTRFDNITNMN